MFVLRNGRHEVFAQNVAKGMSAAKAYKKAGYKPSRHHAGRLMANPKILARIAELTKKSADATDLTAERVLKEMMHLAFYDLTNILEMKNSKITMRDPTTLPEDLRRAIVSIKPVQVGAGLQYECKFADKQKALDSLGRHLQMFKDTLVVENVFRIVNEMEDDELDRRLTELERSYAQATALGAAAGENPESIH